MPKLLEGTGGTKTKIYCQQIIHQRCALAVLRTITLGLNKVGNQAKPLSILKRKEKKRKEKEKKKKKVIFRTNLEQMFKHTALIQSW